MDKEPVIEYSYHDFAVGRSIRVYADGTVECISGSPKYIGGSVRYTIELDKLLMSIVIPQEKVREYAERLEQLGFLDFPDKYSEVKSVHTGRQKTLTLRHKGRTKQVSYSSDHSPSDKLDKLTHELFKLVESTHH